MSGERMNSIIYSASYSIYSTEAVKRVAFSSISNIVYRAKVAQTCYAFATFTQQLLIYELCHDVLFKWIKKNEQGKRLDGNTPL